VILILDVRGKKELQRECQRKFNSENFSLFKIT